MEKDDKSPKEKESDTPQVPQSTSPEGTPTKPTMIEEARAERILLEKVRDDIRGENDRTERLKANAELGGQTGFSPEAEKKPEETPQEYAKKVMAGEIKGTMEVE